MAMDMGGRMASAPVFFAPSRQRPTSLTFDIPQANFGNSPISVTTPRSRIGTPLVFMSINGTPLTPGSKRRPDDTDTLSDYHLEDFSGAPALKMFTIDDTVVDKIVKDGYMMNENVEEDEWNDYPPIPIPDNPTPMPPQTPGDFEMEMNVDNCDGGTPSSPSREFGYKKAKRRLANTPECWEDPPLWKNALVEPNNYVRQVRQRLSSADEEDWDLNRE